MDQRRGSADGCGNVKRSVRGDCSTGCCERERETASEVKNEKIFAPEAKFGKLKYHFWETQFHVARLQHICSFNMNLIMQHMLKMTE